MTYSSATSVFVDVVFNVNANTNSPHLYHLLRTTLTSKRDNLLTRIPTSKLFTTKVTMSGSFNHAVALDDTRFITLHDPRELIIWRITKTELIKEKEISFQSDENNCWEVAVVDGVAHVLSTHNIVRIDLRQNKQLSTITLTDKYATRYSHPTMYVGQKKVIVAFCDDMLGVYSTSGEFQKVVPEKEMEEETYSVCGVDDNVIAIGAEDHLYIYNMKLKKFELAWSSESKVISLQYFSDLSLLVCGTGNGSTIFVDVKKRQVTGQYYSTGTWNTVVRVGKTWVAAIYQSDKVEIIDVFTHTLVHTYEEQVGFSVVPMGDRLVLLTDHEVSVCV